MNRKYLKQTLAGGLCLALAAGIPVQPVQAGSELNMYRLYNPNSGEHFYTSSPNEKNTLTSLGWTDEGIGWVAPDSGAPVYRLYNPNAGDHHYTLDTNEKNTLVSLGWKDEGIGWHSDLAKTIPVYREYNPNALAGAHNYTTSLDEHQNLVRIGWHDEGTGWYALKKGSVAPVSNTLERLHVQGSQLVNGQNQPVVLQGFSTFGLNYMPEYVNEGVFRFLKEQMNSDVIRLALYTQESGGYCSGGSQEQLKALIDQGVNAAEKTGQYVIIDWHILSDGNPNTHINEAAAFFNEMSARYKDKTHVFYEICNEPNGVDWNTIKQYANQIIPVIRKNDPNGVILVGTPTWSQDVDVASQSPLTGYSNIMYTLHFYAATHKENIRNKLISAHANGLPVFVSEFGISSADGNGSLDPASGNAWISLLNQYGISRVGWALSNKNEASALFVPGSSTALNLNDLSASGKWFHQVYTNRAIPSATPSASTPSTPAAPSPTSQSGSLKASLKTVNSWMANSEHATQYGITLENQSSAAKNGWQVTLHFSARPTVSNSWGCSILAKGNSLVLKPASYNQRVEAGQSLDNIGLIVETADGSAPAISVQ